MDSRERTFLALSFLQPDRVPTDLWMSKAFRRRLFSGVSLREQEFLDAYDVDLRYIDGPAYVGPPLRCFPDGTSEDIWGVRRRTVTVGTGNCVETYEEVAFSPLAGATTVEEIHEYPGWPSPDWFDYSRIAEQCVRARRHGRVAVFMGDRLNRIAQLKPAMYLRGVEQIFVDMVERPDIARAIFANIRRFYVTYSQRIFEAARGQLDIVLTGDDFGSQNGPLLSPGTWTQFLGEGFAEYTRIAKNYGLRVMHHTCGAVRPIIPLMIERGLDVLQSLQPEAHEMDARSLKAEFGGRLAFHGGISVQRTLPRGSPEDVRREVRDRVEALAPGGGYILCTSHNIQADVPVENVIALLKAYADFGRYS